MLVSLEWPVPAGACRTAGRWGHGGMLRGKQRGGGGGRPCGEQVSVERSRGGDGVGGSSGETPACNRPQLNRHNSPKRRPAVARQGRPGRRPGRLLGGRRAGGSGPEVVGRGVGGGGLWWRATTGGYWVARAGYPLSTSRQGVGHRVWGDLRPPPMMVERQDGASSNR